MKRSGEPGTPAGGANGNPAQAKQTESSPNQADRTTGERQCVIVEHRHPADIGRVHGPCKLGDADAVEGGKWQRAYLNSFASTIGGGTSQIQANIIGERVLGLPKD